MPQDPQPELLGATRRVVVVLGLVIDRLGTVIYGEVVDPQVEGKFRFVGSKGIGEDANVGEFASEPALWSTSRADPQRFLRYEGLVQFIEEKFQGTILSAW